MESLEKSGGGRPKMRKEIAPAQVEQLAAEGKSVAAICQTLGISDMTFYKRLKDDGAVAAAYNRGKAAAGKTPRAASAQPPAIETVPAETSAEPLSAEEKVKAAIRAGARTRAQIKERTELGYDKIALALELLEFEERSITAREGQGGMMEFHITGEEPMTQSAISGQESDIREQISEETPAAPRLPARNGSAKKRATKARAASKREISPGAKRGAKKGSKRGGRRRRVETSAPLPAESVAVEPAEHGNGKAGRAIAAAYVELHYHKCWGGPSPRFEEVMVLLSEVLPQEYVTLAQL